MLGTGGSPLRSAPSRLLLACVHRRASSRVFSIPGPQELDQRQQRQSQPQHESLKYIRPDRATDTQGDRDKGNRQQQRRGPPDRSDRRPGRPSQPWQRQGAEPRQRQDQPRRDLREQRSAEGQHRQQPWQQQETWPQRGRYQEHDQPTYTQQPYSDRYQERPRTPSIELQGEAVYGISTITAALVANRRNLYTLYVQAGVLAMRSMHTCNCRACSGQLMHDVIP